jgi:4-aminobutyrate aminotransferase/(S)-3-amino-2-methylpropionate transaminase
MFAIEHVGIEPDLMTLAKSMGAGTPLAAVVGRASLMDTIQPGGVGGTYGGNPVACAAALEAIRIIEGLVTSGRAAALGARLRARLDQLATAHPIIGDVRGVGAMQAIELVRDRATKEPASSETSAIVGAARGKGLLLFPAGTYGNVIRFLMPLVATDAELDEGLEVLNSAITSVTR